MASIEPFIHRKVVVLHQDSTVTQAARAMCEHRIGCVMIADHEGHLMGIVTDRDLVCRSRAQGAGPEQKLFEVMTRNLVTIDEYAKVEDVVNLMEIYGVRRIPVVQRKALPRESYQERCVGIVTLDDLIASRSIEHVRLARIVQSQVFRRRSAIFGRTEAIRAVARSAAREEESLRHFYRILGQRMGLPIERAEPVVKSILTDVVQRLHYTGAAHLISQLPRAIQDELVDLPSGPDRTITLSSIALGLSQQFGFEQSEAKTILSRFWGGLRELISAAQLSHVEAQLPRDFREVLAPAESGEEDDQLAAGGIAEYL